MDTNRNLRRDRWFCNAYHGHGESHDGKPGPDCIGGWAEELALEGPLALEGSAVALGEQPVLEEPALAREGGPELLRRVEQEELEQPPEKQVGPPEKLDQLVQLDRSD